ncbi:ParM/StbA family protein [Chamaesiphon sp.]|uniref:ParM/StbA family protein n=1 Tax=Chamaesiphon sp. TaxID=2814140 RepID=UPI003593E960
MNNQHIIDRVYFDGGNRAGKIKEGIDVPVVRRSCIAWVKGDLPKGTFESPVATFREFGGKSKSCVVGRLAQMRSGQNTFSYDKVDLLKYFLLASLTPRPATYIRELCIATPLLLSGDRKQILHNLIGTHEYVCNGIQCLVTIESVKTVDEAVGAYWYAVERGLYQDLSYSNGVLDVGGLNIHAFAFDPDGNKLDISFQNDLGTIALAKKIVKHPYVKQQISTALDISIVMDAIEDRSFMVRDKANFRQIFGECVDEWINEISASIKDAWLAAPNLGNFMMVGGSAPLLKSYEIRTGGRFFLPPSNDDCFIDPQLVALLGMEYVR